MVAVDCHECAVAAAARALIPVLLFSSWDRVPYWTKRANGSTEVTPLVNRIFSNLIINGYGGVWTLDHDDGSSYYDDTSNFLVYGGCKNYKGDHKNCGPNNVILFPGIFSRSSSGSSSPPRWGSCQTNDKCDVLHCVLLLVLVLLLLRLISPVWLMQRPPRLRPPWLLRF